jgi:hypothetical protein
MGESDEREILKKWLLENYPTEAVFIDEINKNVSDMFQKAGYPSMPKNKPLDLVFQAVKRNETDYPELAMNSAMTTLFLGGMAKAISDVILTEILPKIMPETKKCKKCDASNNKVVRYCFQCGEKFDDK